MKHNDDDALLNELYLLEKECKYIEARVKELRDLCKDRGSFASESFVCAVVEQTRTGLAPAQEFADILGPDFLTDNCLIKVHKFLIVKVAPKNHIEELVSL